LRVFIKEGNFKCKEYKIKILDSKVSPEKFFKEQVPNLAISMETVFLTFL